MSITEPADDNATGTLLEDIIESVEESYSENLGHEVVRGTREAASRARSVTEPSNGKTATDKTAIPYLFSFSRCRAEL